MIDRLVTNNNYRTFLEKFMFWHLSYVPQQRFGYTLDTDSRFTTLRESMHSVYQSSLILAILGEPPDQDPLSFEQPSWLLLEPVTFS